MGVYNEIKLLLKELSDAKVKQTRIAGEKLQRLLSQPEARRKLALEVVVPSEYRKGNGKRAKVSTMGARKAALSEVWNMIIRKSIMATQGIVDGKSKVLESDIQLPLNLIRLCDLQVTDDDNEYIVYNPIDPLLPEQQYYWMSKLDKTTLREVFEFCMELLENESALQISELPLLKFLGYICSRRNYVAYFKPHGEICAILDEVKKRFDDGMQRGENYNFTNNEQCILLESSKIFENIVRTSTDIGIGIELFVSEWIRIISKWCQLHTSAVRMMTEMQHLLNGLCIMISCHTEISIMPITRHGRSILSFIKKRYKNVDPSLRLAMNRYLLCHLMIGLAAGKQSGMMPGDLGDLGSASLNGKQLFVFLELVLHDIETSTIGETLPLEASPKIRLELFARYLSCAQRMHINSSQWARIGDETVRGLIEKLNFSMDHSTDRNRYQNLRLLKDDHTIPTISTTAGDVAVSPFVHFVFGHLRIITGGEGFALKEENFQIPLLLEAALAFATSTSVERRADSTKKLVTLLQMVFASADLFPLGSCWTSNASVGWRRLTVPAPDDLFVENIALLVNVASMKDVSSILHVLSDVLEMYGGSSIVPATPCIRKWTILCLVNLTKTTMMLQIIEDPGPVDSTSSSLLQSVWRRIWKLLFKPNLSYLSATKSISQGSDGELVLILLLNIIRFKCIDVQINEPTFTDRPGSTRSDSFLHRCQADVWTLPLFEKVDNIKDGSPVPFALIYCVVLYVGLNDQENHHFTYRSEPTTARKFLHQFCIQFIEKNIDKARHRAAVSAASTCVTSLCNVYADANTIIFNVLNNYLQPIFPTLTDCKSLENDLLEQDSCSRKQCRDLNYFLWEHMLSLQYPAMKKMNLDLYVDDALNEVLQVTKVLSDSRSASRVDSLPLSQALTLFECARESFYMLQKTPGLLSTSTQKEGALSTFNIPLSQKVLAVKVLLSLVLANRRHLKNTDWDITLDFAASVFTEVKSRMSNRNFHQEDLAISCSGIQGIFCAIIDTHTEVGLALPATFRESCSSVYEACKEILENFAPGVQVSDRLDVAVASSADDVLMCDDSEDEFAEKRNKIPTVDLELASEKVKTLTRKRAGDPIHSTIMSCDLTSISTRQELAFCAASLLLTLNPSYSECNFVAKTLVGLDRLDDDRIVTKYNVNLLGAIQATEIICSEVAFCHQVARIKLFQSNDYEIDDSSLPNLLCRIIQCVRKITEPCSDFFLFGFRLCARIVSLADGIYGGKGLTDDESADIISIVLCSENEGRFLSRRPGHRLEQLVCATRMFSVGNPCFRSVFGREFPRTVVLPSLVDVHGVVRRGACRAIAAVIQSLSDENSVVEAVRKRLPPILATQRRGDAKSDFRNWCIGKNSSSDDLLDALKSQLWEDSFVSFESTYVQSMATILRHSSNVSIQHQALFDLLLLASYRRTLQATIFQAIDQIAVDRQYVNATTYLDLHKKSVLSKWIESSTSLFEVSSLQASPKITAFLIRQGRCQELLSLHVSDEINGLEDLTVSDYLLRNMDVVVPRFLVIALQTLNNTSNDECIDSILANDYFREIASLVSKSDGTTALKFVLKSNFASIVAYAMARNGDETIRFLKLCLSEDYYERRMNKASASIFLHLIEQVGELSSEIGIDAYFEVAQKLLNNCESNCSAYTDPFEMVGASTTEVLILIKFWIDQCVNTVELSRRQLSLYVVVRIIAYHARTRNDSSTKLGFCIHLLLCIVADERLVTVRKTSFESLRILIKAISIKTKNSNSNLVKDIFYVVLNAHESYQQKLLNVCADRQTVEKTILYRSLGATRWLSHPSSQGDFWGWTSDAENVNASNHSISFYEHLCQVDGVLRELIYASFSVLQDIINLGCLVGLESVSSSLLHSISAEVQDALFKCDARLCAQKLVLEFISNQQPTEDDGRNEAIPVILVRSKDSVNGQSKTGFQIDSIDNHIHKGSLSGNQTVLLTCLRELQSYLVDHDLNERDTFDLVQLLCSLCRNDFTTDVRILASQCLGEIDVSSLTSSPITSIGDHDWIAAYLTAENVFDALKARCIYALSTSLHSKDSQIALTALWTMKDIQSSTSSINLRDFRVDEDTIDLVQSICKCQQPIQLSSAMLLTDMEIKEIRGGNSFSDINSEWCLDPQFWIQSLGNNFSFHIWIRKVVPALLVCLYGKDCGSERSSKAMFFRVCQRMSFVDPSFAEALFPVIILDLLLNVDNNSDNSKPNSVFLDTWLVPYEHHFRCKLSNCFEEMLRHFTLNSTNFKMIDSRSIELLLNCLDLLRRLTQHRFDSSSNHRRNSTCRENGSARKSSTHYPEGKAVVDNKSCAAPWQGFPFGIVFSLDGTLVAESCLRCGRYSSAIFYLEMSVNGRHLGSMQKLESETTRSNASSIHNCQVGDISGYGTSATNECRLPTSSFASLLQRCYLKLGEQTAAKVLQEDAATDMMSNDLLVLEGHEAPFEQLQKIENLSHAVGRSNGLTIHLSQALETAGLRNTLNTYLQGLVAENHIFSAVDQATIKEQWYSCQLFERQWNDLVFDKNQNRNDATIPSTGWLAERSTSPGFYECLERSISALVAADFDSSQESLRNARLRLIDEITIFDQDVASQWSKFEKVDKLRVLNGLDTLSVGTLSIPSLLSPSRSIGEKKKLEDKSAFTQFRFPAIMHEIALRNFPYGDTSPHLSVAKDCLIEHLKAEAFTTCELGFHKECDAILHRLQSVCADKRLNTVLEVQLQKAALLESKNDFTGAIRRVQNVLQVLQERPIEINNLDILMIDALLMCGGLLSKHSIENASSVQSNYIMPASKRAKLMYAKNPNPENTKRSIKSLFALSHVAFRMFENVSNRVKSVIWQNAGCGLKERRMAIGQSDDLIEKAMRRLQSIKKKGSPEFLEAEKEVKELQVYRIHLEREINNTEEERTVILSSIQDHRMQAMQAIVSALCLCGVDNAEDLSKFVFRLVSMWFSSDDEEMWNESIGSVIKEAVANVPTFRFVSLYPQLLSRLSGDGMLLTDSCQNLLQQLIYKMCVQHPYHCIVPLISVANGRTASTSSAFHSKGDIANAIVRKIKNDGGNFLFQVTEGYERLATAYIHLAMADTKEFHRGHSAKIPFVKVCKNAALRLDKCLISGRRDDSYLPCILTKTPAIRPSCDYGDGLEEPIGSERIASFESYFSVTEGGLHRPKIVTCIGTKGGRFRELVKGEDETRQDAVMEQVFTYVNSIMARQRDIQKVLPNVTRISTQSNLNLVTYNIVPLSPLAGVLEWVEHAIPFGDFIADKTGKRSNDVGAHSRYYPGEWGHGQCRSHLDSAPRSEKRKAFDELCHNNSPVFRYFFVERFGYSMQCWYMAKTRYTRSVAVSSVVGHILGIGDRHTSNILVHQKTGEVVHIDFGIVFEQGKLLNAPEKVPFRLTRNVVDGMGPLGIEGVFRSAAETTLLALKSNSGALLTILSAIVADPLYKWTLQTHDHEYATDSVRKKRNSNSKSQAQLSHIPPAIIKIQGEDSNKSKNEAAEHAIRKISEKLQGYEDGTVGEQQSVVGQISFLVNSARDADNLSVMFPGWAPWV